MKFRERMKNIGTFDRFVIAGGLVNLLVIGYLLTYWLLH